MDDCISRKAVLERVKYAVVTSSGAVEREDVDAWCKGASDALDQACDAIRDVPAANNVTKVVRCKQCRYSKWSEKNQKYYCQRRWAMHGVRERDFCSYGKRRDNGR